MVSLRVEDAVIQVNHCFERARRMKLSTNTQSQGDWKLEVIVDKSPVLFALMSRTSNLPTCLALYLWMCDQTRCYSPR